MPPKDLEDSVAKAVGKRARAPLTDREIAVAKATGKRYRMYDQMGLYLEVQPGGAKYWRLKYHFNGKERRLAIGVYPRVSLKDARLRSCTAHAGLGKGEDPGQKRRMERMLKDVGPGETFAELSREWLARQKNVWSASHAVKVEAMVNRDLIPWLGKTAMRDIKPVELLSVLRRIESRGAIDTTKRARIVAGQIMRFAVACGKADRDFTADLKGALTPVRPGHLAAITEPKEVGQLMSAIYHYEGSLIVRTALRLAPLTFVRPGELRTAKWADVDLEAGEWRIPAERMKMGQPHVVPLSRQAISLFRDLRPLTGRWDYVFPGQRSGRRPMSENAILMALRTIGYGKDQMTGHGFRAMARTILDEVLQVRVDLIEHQLSHAVRDANGRAYNRTSHLPARKEMMQQWADYLDELRRDFDKRSLKVVPFIRAA